MECRQAFLSARLGIKVVGSCQYQGVTSLEHLLLDQQINPSKPIGGGLRFDYEVSSSLGMGGRGDSPTFWLDKLEQVSHPLQELYGDATAGDMLSSLSRLWTTFLQMNGFTCGIGDLLLTQTAETQRTALVAQAELRAMSASAEYVALPTGDIAGVTDTHVRSSAPVSILQTAPAPVAPRLYACIEKVFQTALSCQSAAALTSVAMLFP